MARKPTIAPVDAAAFDTPGAVVHDISLADEITTSYLEYAYSTIHARALPDARDGLKPVHRRILFSMSESNLRPDRTYVKSARVVGDVMGRLHPHGDSAIYDTMVRLAQPFSLNTPLIDGKGNWGGSPDDAAAAARYTECRMSPFAVLMTNEIDEETVDFVPNYDGSLLEPVVLPSAFPNLLVNGTSGIAVGMSTNMIPHNLSEVIAAARHLIKFPEARLDTLMGMIPGPDLPTGGVLIGMDQVRAAYETGRGIVRIRGRAEIGPLEGSRGRIAITVTELPYQIGAEKVIEAIKKEISSKRLQGVADVKDLTDRIHGTRLVIEAKTGVNAQALLADLYRLTPLETSFGITNLALVDGQPRTLGLRDLLTVFLEHRFSVVTRRTQFRKRKAEERLHIVDGLLIALDNIDEVVRIIRGSKDTAEARAKLIKRFALSDIQAGHILDMPLRRLVALEVETLREERATLLAAIAGFDAILNDESMLKKVVSDELAQVAKDHPTPRRTTLVDGDLKEVLEASKPAGPIEVADDPCQVLLSASGLLARTAGASEEVEDMRARKGRTKHDQIRAVVDATARGQIVVVTSAGRGFKTDVLTLPTLPNRLGTVSLSGGMSASEIVALQPGERVVGIAPLVEDYGDAPGLAMGTRQGVVKVTRPEWPVRSDEFDVIGLRDGDEILNAVWLNGSEDLVFVTSDAQLLRFPAAKVRPQGLSGGGMAGINLGDGAEVVSFNAVDPTDDDVMVVTGTGVTVKVTPFTEFPVKGRATGGVNCQRFLARQGESRLVLAWVGPAPQGGGEKGDPIDLPHRDPRRSGSGTPADGLALVGWGLEREPA